VRFAYLNNFRESFRGDDIFPKIENLSLGSQRGRERKELTWRLLNFTRYSEITEQSLQDHKRRVRGGGEGEWKNKTKEGGAGSQILISQIAIKENKFLNLKSELLSYRNKFQNCCKFSWSKLIGTDF
jgi:hypothetical protein